MSPTTLAPVRLLWTLRKNDRHLRLTERSVEGGHFIALYEDAALLHSGIVAKDDIPLVTVRWRSWFEGAGWCLPEGGPRSSWPWSEAQPGAQFNAA